MRRLVLAALPAALLAAGCGSAAQTTKNPEPQGSATPARVRHVAVGAALGLTAPARPDGTGVLHMAVKVKRVLPRALGRGGFDRPRKGERFVAALFVLKNIGTTPYADSPTYGAKAIDSHGHGYDPTVVSVAAGPGFPKVVRMRHGQVRAGYIVFAVPRATKITAVRYALNGGIASDAGEWRMPETPSR